MSKKRDTSSHIIWDHRNTGPAYPYKQKAFGTPAVIDESSNHIHFHLARGNPTGATFGGEEFDSEVPINYTFGPDPIGIRYFILGIPKN